MRTVLQPYSVSPAFFDRRPLRGRAYALRLGPPVLPRAATRLLAAAPVVVACAAVVRWPPVRSARWAGFRGLELVLCCSTGRVAGLVVPTAVGASTARCLLVLVVSRLCLSPAAVAVLPRAAVGSYWLGLPVGVALVVVVVLLALLPASAAAEAAPWSTRRLPVVAACVCLLLLVGVLSILWAGGHVVLLHVSWLWFLPVVWLGAGASCPSGCG